MVSNIPNEWLENPPESLVVGDGPYVLALAAILGTKSLSLGDLRIIPDRSDSGGYPQVFDSLKRVLLVVPQNCSAAEALQMHRAVWNWVEKLSSAGDQHELAFVFILPLGSLQEYSIALAVGLSVREIDPTTMGHASWIRSGRLAELLDVIASIKPMDILPLRVRKVADVRHAAIEKLRLALTGNIPVKAAEAAQDVLKSFPGQEFLLDIFCRPPCHFNGNLLRSWLHEAVTNPVTQECWATGKQQLINWLAETETDRIK